MKVRSRALRVIGDDGFVMFENIIPSRHSRQLIPLLLMHPEWKCGAEIGVAKGRTLKAILDQTSLNMFAVELLSFNE